MKNHDSLESTRNKKQNNVFAFCDLGEKHFIYFLSVRGLGLFLPLVNHKQREK